MKEHITKLNLVVQTYLKYSIIFNLYVMFIQESFDQFYLTLGGFVFNINLSG